MIKETKAKDYDKQYKCMKALIFFMCGDKYNYDKVNRYGRTVVLNPFLSIVTKMKNDIQGVSYPILPLLRVCAGMKMTQIGITIAVVNYFY